MKSTFVCVLLCTQISFAMEKQETQKELAEINKDESQTKKTQHKRSKSSPPTTATALKIIKSIATSSSETKKNSEDEWFEISLNDSKMSNTPVPQTPKTPMQSNDNSPKPNTSTNNTAGDSSSIYTTLIEQMKQLEILYKNESKTVSTASTTLSQ